MAKKSGVKVASEATEQSLLIRWWSLFAAAQQLPEKALFAIPNGGSRNIIEAARLKKQGVRSGIPDLFLAMPRGTYHGLFVELKREKGGRVSPEQKEVCGFLAENGYLCYICKGFTEARQLIEDYVMQKPTLLFL